MDVWFLFVVSAVRPLMYLSMNFMISDKCVYVYCVDIFAHIEGYSDCSRMGSHLIEPLFYSVI